MLGVEACVGNSGIASLISRVAQAPGAVILMYHSVVSDAEAPWIDPRNSLSVGRFARHMQWLAGNAHVMSMDDLVDTVRSGRSPRPRSVVITFDDGYRDNLTNAAPVLQSFGLPAILYLATGYISSGRPQWIDHLYSSFVYRSGQSLALDDDPGSRHDLRDPHQVDRAYRDCADRLLLMTLEPRNRFLEQLDWQLSPTRTPPRLTLDWSELRQMRREHPFFSIGVHTRDHLDLSEHSSLAEDQVASSVRDVEGELGFRPVHFSFPYCRSNEQVRALVRASGLVSAVASSGAVPCDSTTDLHCLPRIEAPGSMGLFRLYCSGAHGRVRRLMMRRS